MNRIFKTLTNRLTLPPDIYWSLKISAPREYDVVFAGSSRVCRGLSPKHAGHVLAGYKILNFGFHACVMDRTYLDHCRDLVSASPGGGALVLGLSPHTLIRRPGARNWYSLWSEAGPYDGSGHWPRVLMGSLGRNLKPKKYRVRHIKQLLRSMISGPRVLKDRPGTEVRLKDRYHADGWLAAKVLRADPHDYVRRLESVYSRYRVEQDLIDEMLGAVRDFSAAGVRVFGFNPPTNQAMRNLEARSSGLDLSLLIKEFRHAGGIWLQVDEASFESYDGSHLDEDAAIRLSTYLATLMRPYLADPAAEPGFKARITPPRMAQGTKA